MTICYTLSWSALQPQGSCGARGVHVCTLESSSFPLGRAMIISTEEVVDDWMVMGIVANHSL